MKEMKTTQQLLMALFCGFLLAAGVLYVLGEFLQVDMAFLANPSRQTQFLCSTVMILFTISLLPLSLRLFKFRRVNDDLISRKHEALKRWGTIRLSLMGGLLVVNTLLYYAFGFQSTYGYLAVVTLLCMPFVLPTMSRCQAEVEKEVEEEKMEPQDEEESLTEDENDEETNDSHRQL